jgi:polyphosphate kinase
VGKEKTGKTTAEAKPGRLKGKEYRKALAQLQADLCNLQEWVRNSGERIVIVFEGRDTAGKGGVIKRIVEKVSPRVFRVVALPAPNDRERTQFYYQRYVEHLPAAGEVVLFDRSWYNRAGVERVMGFCTDHEYQEFMRTCPGFEFALVQSGIRLVKYWLDVGPEEQEQRFLSRMTDPTKHWKLSPMDLEARRRWYDYSRAYDAMFAATHTSWAPWHLVNANDQRRARLNCISHLLSQLPWTEVEWEAPALPERQEPGDYHYPALDIEPVPARW